jgi:undecaprenyldiphospho-muramoylpentapeptide beta-N-acetylglucosaminyltransferase
LLICAGGTGGGVYPALAVLQALGNEADPVLWVGGEGGMEEELVKRNNLAFTTIPAGQVHGIGIRSLPRNLWQLWRGFLASRRILHQFKPDAMLFTGGYLAVPMAIAGVTTPKLLYVPDIQPGMALKALASFANQIAITTEEGRRYFRRKAPITVTGYPTRAGLADWLPAQAAELLGLNGKLPVVLAAGGSKGARSINRALVAVLPELLKIAQVVHITGQTDWLECQAAQANLPGDLAQNYHAMPYLHEMGAALASANLVISRAGASTLGEYPLFGLPAVLSPYPYSWVYQKINAAYLEQRGAAVVIANDQLPSQLLPTLTGLLGDPHRMQSMRSAMRSLARPDAAHKIACLIKELSSRTVKGAVSSW